METIISAVIAGICGIIGAIIGAAINARTLKPMLPVGFWSRLVSFLVTLISGVITALVAYFLISLIFLSPCGPFAPTSITITSPASNSRVSNQITVQGTACHIPQDNELWLLVQVNGVRGYFPQPGPIVVSSDGTWSAPANIGSDADSGRGFTLNTALVDQNDTAAKDAIQKYLNQPGPVYMPLDPLPSGIRLMSQVPVVRT